MGLAWGYPFRYPPFGVDVKPQEVIGLRWPGRLYLPPISRISPKKLHHLLVGQILVRELKNTMLSGLRPK